MLYNGLYSDPIRIEDSLDFRILDRFFRSMVHQSEYGYVLDGSKPISAIDIFSLENLPVPGSPRFALITYSREVIEVWQRLQPAQSDIVLKITKIFDPVSTMENYEFLFVNKSKLQEILELNIDLFRYVLGPSLDSNSLLKHILESSESLSSILRDNRVLEGIVLGFGTYNSLMHSHSEGLHNTLRQDFPPFFRRCELMCSGIDMLRNHAYFLLSNNSTFYTTIPSQTGLGFTSAADELNFINEQMLALPAVLEKENPPFIFGAYKNAENPQLIVDLKISQKHVQEMLQRSDFLEYILEKITGEKPIINCSPLQNKCFSLQGNVEQAVAKGIWSTYSQLDNWTIPEFIEAFCRRDPQDKERPKLNLMPRFLSGLELAQRNLKFSEEQISARSRTEQLEEIIPNYLYFKRLRSGNGDSLNSANELLMSYTIEDGQGNVFAARHNCWIKLSETIVGFILGMQGMKEGEERQIFIHPAYGYGVSTILPPCSFLIATIKLHKVNHHSKSILPSLEPHDLSWIKDPEIYEEIKRSSLQLARSLGSIWGIWLSKNPDLNFSKLCEELKSLSQNDSSSTLSMEEQHMCNRVFWNYFSKNKNLSDKK